MPELSAGNGDKMNRHAEIAGGGIGGLSSAVMLAQQGWTVRVHERSPEIREVGTGIYLKNNAIEVLEEAGIFDRLVPNGVRLERSQVLNREGRIMQDRALKDRSRVHVFLRQTLIEVLRDTAERAGVEIVTGSTAIAADPTGELLLEGGQRLRADLVIAADGVRSRVRNSLGVDGSYKWLPTIVNRYLVTSREITPDPVTREHWSNRCRIGITPCGDDLTYIYQVCPEWDKAAMVLPSNVAFWSERLPPTATEIEILSQTEARQHNFSIVRCLSWQKGAVARHRRCGARLTSNTGSGCRPHSDECARTCRVSSPHPAVAEALPAWETTMRFISDRTQRWAMRYDFFTRQWPTALWFVRPAIIWAFRSLPALNRRMRIADQGLRLTAFESLPATHRVKLN